MRNASQWLCLDGGSMGRRSDPERRPAVASEPRCLGLSATQSGLSQRGARPPRGLPREGCPSVSRTGRFGARSAPRPVDRKVHEHSRPLPAARAMAGSNEALELQQKGAGAGPLTTSYCTRPQPQERWRCLASWSESILDPDSKRVKKFQFAPSKPAVRLYIGTSAKVALTSSKHFPGLAKCRLGTF